MAGQFQTVQHGIILPGDIHSFANWVVADTVERNALGPLMATDLHKICYVIASQQYFSLISYFPAVWTGLGSEGTAKSMLTISPVGGVLSLTALDYEIINVVLTQNVTSVIIGANTSPNTAVLQTIIFRQTGGGGFTVSGWPIPPAIKWENGMLPSIDTTSGGVTTLEFVYGFGEALLGTS